MDWQSLKQCVSTCEACQLAKTRLNTVFGVGDPAAEWLFIGEAPGAQEDQQGEPFVGQAGKLLDNMLQALALKRGQNVFIANIVKCRPPGNRDPQAEEIAQCAPFLKRQIELIKPKLIVALGRVAAQSLLNTQEKSGRCAINNMTSTIFPLLSHIIPPICYAICQTRPRHGKTCVTLKGFAEIEFGCTIIIAIIFSMEN